MAAPCWMFVTVVFLMIAGNGLTAVDQNQLAPIVEEILNRYTPTTDKRIPPMFSVAVSIPYNSFKKMYDISEVTDSGEEVRETILKCDVYTSTRLVAATVLRWPNVLTQCPNELVQWPDVLRKCHKRRVQTWAEVQKQCPNAVHDGRADHAEYRTLQNFNTLLKHCKKNDLMIFYVRASPCDQRCTSQTHRWSILNSINQILNWDNYAVVFSDVFKPRDGKDIPQDNLRESLERLGRSSKRQRSIGLENIFRCNRGGNSRSVQCRSCSMNGQVTPYCFSDSLQHGSKGNRSRQSGDRGQSGTKFINKNIDSNAVSGWRAFRRDKVRKVGKSKKRQESAWTRTRRQGIKK